MNRIGSKEVNHNFNHIPAILKILSILSNSLGLI
jgi:hypothetical protein